MRVWDVKPYLLCRQHLLGEHREIHVIWTVITKDRKGYSHHPETKRWVDNLAGLSERHDAIVDEMKSRGYNHNSPLEYNGKLTKRPFTVFVDSYCRQLELLRSKKCNCLERYYEPNAGGPLCQSLGHCICEGEYGT